MQPKPGRRYGGLLANALALLLLLGYVASMAVPASEATRLRNALLVVESTPADVEWTPASRPASFAAETRSAPDSLRHAVADIVAANQGDDWGLALGLADHLTRNAKDLGPVQKDVETAYREITQSGRGYCADFTQVYLALAHAAGLFAREWAFSFDGFGGHGHAVVEVFDRRENRWLLIDVFNNVHFRYPHNGRVMTVGDLRTALREQPERITVERNGPGRLGYPRTDKLLAYYRNGLAQWYLWAGNSVLTYDADSWVRAASGVGAPAGQLAAIARGVHPKIAIVRDEGNSGMLDSMLRLRWKLLACLGLAVLLSLGLVWQISSWIKRGTRS